MSTGILLFAAGLWVLLQTTFGPLVQVLGLK